MSDDGATGSNGGNFACSFLQVVGLSVQACHAAVWYPFIFFWIFLEITLDDWVGSGKLILFTSSYDRASY